MDNSKTIIVVVLAGLALLLLFAASPKRWFLIDAIEGGENEQIVSDAPASAVGLPTLEMGSYLINPLYFYNVKKIAYNFPINTSNAQAREAGVVPCGCSGTLNSVYQSSYDDLVAGFNANLKNLADNYTSAMLAGMPTYFSQYINNVAAAQATGNFQADYNALG
jgi:hypothetical protein